MCCFFLTPDQKATIMARQKRVHNLHVVNEPKISIDNGNRTKSLKITLDHLNTISPMTENQKIFFNLFESGIDAILLHGVAGTGKTFIALYKALEQVLDRSSDFQKVIIVRSAVPSREIGHLPGDEKEKSEVYKLPYIDICDSLFNHIQPFVRLEELKAVQFLITSFVRGITLDNSIVIVDECQNMTDMELNSIMTRVGTHSKIIFCGDFRQTDLYKRNDMSGLKKFIAIADAMPSFKVVEFGVDDIVRSKLVKEYIIARLNYEERHC
jgi:phosphate starvation-inducible PhoH-like protein